MSRNWIIAGVAAVCFITGVALSQGIEPAFAPPTTYANFLISGER